MSVDQSQTPPPYKQPPKSSGGGILIGCLGLLLVCLLICGGGLYFVAMNWQSWALQGFATMGREIAVQAVEESELTDEDKRAVIEQIDRVADEAKAGNLTGEQFAKIMENLAESPLLPAGMAKAIEVKYVDPSDLPEDEKAAAKLTLQRGARGAFEKKISPEQLELACDPISNVDSEGKRKLKEQVTTEELREFLANVKKLADEAGIPEEPFGFDVGEEVKKAVDKALAEK